MWPDKDGREISTTGYFEPGNHYNLTDIVKYLK